MLNCWPMMGVDATVAEAVVWYLKVHGSAKRANSFNLQV